MSKNVHLTKRSTAVLLSCLLLAFTAVLPGVSLEASAAAEEYIIGDINDDRCVDSSDAILLLRASVDMESMTEQQTTAGDLDADGVITSIDAVIVLRYSVGISDDRYFKGYLTVIHKTNDGAVITKITRYGNRGKAYETSALNNAFYILDETKLPQNANGLYSYGTTEVIYYYDEAETINSVIHIKADSFTPHIYVWGDHVKNATNNWPGKVPADEDNDGWLDYTVETIDTYNWILNDGNSSGAIQTNDHMNEAGDIWIVAASAWESGITVYKENPDANQP